MFKPPSAPPRNWTISTPWSAPIGHGCCASSRSLGDADLAESITQDCFLKAYNARDRFRGDCSISTWLTSIAVNLIRDQQRLQKFRFWRQARATAIDVTDAANFLPSHESSPESRLLVKEKAGQVYAALQKLSPNQRTVFLMRFAEDLELSEIAAITKIPVNTVKTHLHRALKSVRSQVRAAQAATPQQALAAGTRKSRRARRQRTTTDHELGPNEATLSTGEPS